MHSSASAKHITGNKVELTIYLWSFEHWLYLCDPECGLPSECVSYPLRKQAKVVTFLLQFTFLVVMLISCNLASHDFSLHLQALCSHKGCYTKQFMFKSIKGTLHSSQTHRRGLTFSTLLPIAKLIIFQWHACYTALKFQKSSHIKQFLEYWFFFPTKLQGKYMSSNSYLTLTFIWVVISLVINSQQ